MSADGNLGDRSRTHATVGRIELLPTRVVVAGIGASFTAEHIGRCDPARLLALTLVRGTSGEVIIGNHQVAGGGHLGALVAGPTFARVVLRRARILTRDTALGKRRFHEVGAPTFTDVTPTEGVVVVIDVTVLKEASAGVVGVVVGVVVVVIFVVGVRGTPAVRDTLVERIGVSVARVCHARVNAGIASQMGQTSIIPVTIARAVVTATHARHGDIQHARVPRIQLVQARILLLTHVGTTLAVFAVVRRLVANGQAFTGVVGALLRARWGHKRHTEIALVSLAIAGVPIARVGALRACRTVIRSHPAKA